jgi:nucleotide sugar dehydrogenase
MGLGFVGLTLAVAMAEVGFHVTGVEIREDVVERFKRGKAHFFEPTLDETLSRVIDNGSLRVFTKIPPDCDATVYIIAVGTPLGDDGRIRFDMIQSTSRDVAARMKHGALIILRSTIKIGSTKNIVMPVLDGAGVYYNLAFCPERTLEGKALEELHNLPQIVGGINMTSNTRAAQLFQFLTPTVVRVSDLETAELIKLVDNTLRDVQFAFSNEVTHMCDAIGVSAFEVIKAGKLGYPRTNLAVPGPVGGPCLEKDPYILAETMREHGVEPHIAMAARGVNERQPQECVNYIAQTVAERGAKITKVSLLGLAFKGRPVTDDLRGTMARPILNALKKKFPAADYYGFDNVVADAEINGFGLIPAATLEDAFEAADLVVIANNHPIFSSMPIIGLADKMRRQGLIYDFWNNFDSRELALSAGVRYVSLGAHGLAQRVD